MNKEESLSEAWNSGFEAGISFAQAMAEETALATTIKQEVAKHDFNCLVYICTCKKENN